MAGSPICGSSTRTKRWKSPVLTWSSRQAITTANILPKRRVLVCKSTLGLKMDRVSAECGTNGRSRRQFWVFELMELRKSSIENLRSLVYTQDEARFLYIVAMHSGYFSARQYLTFTRAKSGRKAWRSPRRSWEKVMPRLVCFSETVGAITCLLTSSTEPLAGDIFETP